MRAREPDTEGYVDHDGVPIYYEVHGSGHPTLMLVPASPITHSKIWKGSDSKPGPSLTAS